MILKCIYKQHLLLLLPASHLHPAITDQSVGNRTYSRTHHRKMLLRQIGAAVTGESLLLTLHSSVHLFNNLSVSHLLQSISFHWLMESLWDGQPPTRSSSSPSRAPSESCRPTKYLGSRPLCALEVWPGQRSSAALWTYGDERS